MENVQCLGSFKKLDFLSRFKSHDRFLPVSPAAHTPPETFAFALIVLGSHLVNLDLENPLHSILDFYLVGSTIHLEGQLIVHFLLNRTFFGNQRSSNNFVILFHISPLGLNQLGNAL